jgi:hypothetical protein
MMSKFSINRLIALFVASGFFFLAVDSTLEHWEIFKEEWFAFVPVLYSVLGMGVGVAAVVKWDESWIRKLHLYLTVSFVVGVAGLYFHSESLFENEDEMNAEEREHEEKEKPAPILAPLAFAGLGAVGMIGTSRKWPAELK